MDASGLAPLKRALISVSDKTGLAERAAKLADAGVELLSTGGTLQALRDAGLEARDVSSVTEYPEMMDGRVKTLHPRIHGGLLARRDNEDDLAAMAEHGIPRSIFWWSIFTRLKRPRAPAPISTPASRKSM